ncbi:hypothetical protein Y032_0010g993 [Ancylostoma ceylanicum]|uniref:Uncharacterized protein n=1 Tax=Ancylostoma ceylanicum TaxID=53326 RepID=A0A016VJ98_9BILA|nr:hypothetical protein Y032_0010g993 [Ancylostoma ceylanicum]
MNGLTIVLAALVLGVFSADRKCTTDKDCLAGHKCNGQICAARTECPMRGLPIAKPGCKVVEYLNDMNCPMPKVVCP